MYFDLVPEEYEIREKEVPDFTGRICVISSELKGRCIRNFLKFNQCLIENTFLQRIYNEMIAQMRGNEDKYGK